MKSYNIILMHGPIESTEYIGNDTVLYTLENGEEYKIAFAILNEDGEKKYKRSVACGDGKAYEDVFGFDMFEEELSTEDLAQWTADNWSEIEELISYYNK